MLSVLSYQTPAALGLSRVELDMPPLTMTTLLYPKSRMSWASIAIIRATGS
jgi:hypothetical protein